MSPCSSTAGHWKMASRNSSSDPRRSPSIANTTERTRSMIRYSSKTCAAELGRQMHALAAELFPLCRSLTGPGVRETLARLSQIVPLDVHEVPTGAKAFDWKVPQE